MRFFERQDDARRRTRRLLVVFAAAVGLLVLAVNAGLALTWWALWGWHQPGTVSYPAYFFHVNTGVTLFFVLGGWWIESSNLRGGGGEHFARRAGAREARPGSSPEEQRFCNVVQELAIAARMQPPQPMVVARSAAINAFAAGWEEDDAVVAVTRDALELLTREEMQGLVAHELSHIREGDTRLNMHLAGMVAGLEMVFGLGQSMCERDELGRLRITAIPGFAIEAVGWFGWVAGEGLKAAVSRQREFLADARAVQWTRSRDGLGGVLRKVLTQQRMPGGLAPNWHTGVTHMLLVDGGKDGRVAHWLDPHPTLERRIRRIYGRDMGPLPLHPGS